MLDAETDAETFPHNHASTEALQTEQFLGGDGSPRLSKRPFNVG